MTFSKNKKLKQLWLYIEKSVQKHPRNSDAEIIEHIRNSMPKWSQHPLFSTLRGCRRPLIGLSVTFSQRSLLAAQFIRSAARMEGYPKRKRAWNCFYFIIVMPNARVCLWGEFASGFKRFICFTLERVCLWGSFGGVRGLSLRDLLERCLIHSGSPLPFWMALALETEVGTIFPQWRGSSGRKLKIATRAKSP